MISLSAIWEFVLEMVMISLAIGIIGLLVIATVAMIYMIKDILREMRRNNGKN